MAKDAPQPQQGGRLPQPQPQQSQSSGSGQPQDAQPIFRDWAAI